MVPFNCVVVVTVEVGVVSLSCVVVVTGRLVWCLSVV